MFLCFEMFVYEHFRQSSFIYTYVLYVQVGLRINSGNYFPQMYVSAIITQPSAIIEMNSCGYFVLALLPFYFKMLIKA